MRTFFKRYRKIIAPICILGVIFVLWLIAYERALNYNFNGIVERISYDAQDEPTVIINGTEYDLGCNNWGIHKDKKETIEVGDSLIKIKGQIFIKLIKRNRKDPATFSRK
jgi:hypothetical protein